MKKYGTQYKGNPVSFTMWKDNEIVYVLSLYVAKMSFNFTRKYEPVLTLNVIAVYNKLIGAIDSPDAMLARWRITLKSRNWYFRLFYKFDRHCSHQCLVYTHIVRTIDYVYQKIVRLIFRLI